MKYSALALPYSFDALAPHIDARTMEVHYTKHHAGYVAKLNETIARCPEIADRPLEEMLADISTVPDAARQAIRNLAGGHLNHSVFWQIMGPGCGGRPVGALAKAIDANFTNFDEFRARFTRTAMARFGSGWAWLGLDHRGRLELFSTPNQDSPLMLGYRPILGIDLWEHAYYLTYQNRRGDYIAAWWNVVNWEKLAEIFADCMEKVSHPD